MKKILLATTMLAAATGYASAEVKVSGSVLMGIVDFGNVNAAAPLGNGKAEGAQFLSRVRIQFDGSGTTDGGLTFGATMRADQFGGNGEVAGTDWLHNQQSTAYVSGAFGKVTFGDVAGGALDQLLGQVSYVGYSSLSSWNQVGGIGGGVVGGYLPSGLGTAVYYSYTSGNLSVGVGLAQVGSAEKTANTNKASIAVKYATSMYNAGLGYEANDGNNQLDFKGGVTFGAATLQAKIIQPKWADAANTVKGKTEFAVSLDYAVSPALKLTAFYADHKNDTVDNDPKSVGIGATYDLGGGAKVQGGIAQSGIKGAKTAFDLGVTMAF